MADDTAVAGVSATADDPSTMSDSDLQQKVQEGWAKYYTQPGVGKTEWTHEGVEPSSEAGMARTTDFLRTHAMAGKDWKEVAPKFIEHFPTATVNPARDEFTQHKQNIELDKERKKYEGKEETTGSRLFRRSIPGASTMVNINRQRAVAAAQQHMKDGTAGPDDYSILANAEAVQKADEKDSSTTGGAIEAGLEHLPAVVGEAMSGGTAIKALGIGMQATKAGMVAIPLLSRGGVTAAAKQLAVQTAYMPSMWAENMTRKNLSQGRDYLDPRGFAPAFALGMLQTAAFKATGDVGGVVGGKGPAAWLGRLATGTTAGVAGMEIADVLGSTLSIGLPSGYKLKANEAETGYGTLGQLIEGGAGDAQKHLAVNLVTFLAFASLHAHQRPKWATDRENPKIIQAYTESMQELKAKGLSPEEAARQHPFNQAVEHLVSALEANPDLTPAQVRQLATHLAEGKGRDFVVDLASRWPDIMDKTPKQEEPFGPDAGKDTFSPQSPKMENSFDVPITRENIDAENERRAEWGKPPATIQEIIRAFRSKPTRQDVLQAATVMGAKQNPNQPPPNRPGQPPQQIGYQVHGPEQPPEPPPAPPEPSSGPKPPPQPPAAPQGQPEPTGRPGQPTSDLDETTKALGLGPAVKEVPPKSTPPQGQVKPFEHLTSGQVEWVANAVLGKTLRSPASLAEHFRLKGWSQEAIQKMSDRFGTETQSVSKPAEPAPNQPAPPRQVGEGWKLHLATDKPEEVAKILKDLGLAHKVGRSGGQEGKDLTVYIGSKDKAAEVARAIEEKAGHLLNEPHGDTLKDDVTFGGKVMGRFDTGKHEHGFHQYGSQGIPHLAADMDPWNKPPVAEARARAHAELVKRYGEFYTGTQQETQVAKPAISSSANMPSEPARTGAKEMTSGQKTLAGKILQQMTTSDHPNAEEMHALLNPAHLEDFWKIGKVRDMLDRLADEGELEKHQPAGKEAFYTVKRIPATLPEVDAAIPQAAKEYEDARRAIDVIASGDTELPAPIRPAAEEAVRHATEAGKASDALEGTAQPPAAAHGEDAGATGRGGKKAGDRLTPQVVKGLTGKQIRFVSQALGEEAPKVAYRGRSGKEPAMSDTDLREMEGAIEALPVSEQSKMLMRTHLKDLMDERGIEPSKSLQNKVEDFTPQVTSGGEKAGGTGPDRFNQPKPNLTFKGFLSDEHGSSPLPEKMLEMWELVKKLFRGPPPDPRYQASMVDDMKQTLAPSTRGPEAEVGGGNLRYRNAEERQARYRAVHDLEKGRKFFDSYIVKEKEQAKGTQRLVDFLDHMQGVDGKKIADLPPELRAFAEASRAMIEQREAMAVERGMIPEDTIPDYMTQLWKKNGQEISPEMYQAIFGSKKPFAGKEGFKKARSIPNYSTGIAAGLEPVSRNPMDLVLMGLEQVDKAVKAFDAREDWTANGLRRGISLGEDLPHGWAYFQDESIFGRGGRGPELLWRFAGPETLVRLADNYLSKGLKGRPIYDAVRSFGDNLNNFQLGFTAFHAGFVVMDAQVSAVAMGLRQISQGDVAKGLGSIAKGIITPIAAWSRGSKLLADYSSGKRTPDVDAFLHAGGSVEDSFYRSNHIAAFTDAIDNVRRGEGGYGSALFHALPAVAEMFSKPVMKYLVPRMKLGVFSMMAEAEMSKLPPNADANMKQATYGRVWDSVENRLGQVTYDNKFWNKTFKDLLMVSCRSVGWNVGTWGEIGGGVKDVGKAYSDVKRGEGISHRLAYVAALPLVVGAYGALYGYLAGKPPEEVKDYFFPRTGRVRPDGSEDRIALPSYMRDIASLINRGDEGPMRLGQNVKEMAYHKLNPGLAVLGQMFGNEDFYGTAIRNPSDPMVEQSIDTAYHLLKAMKPMGASAIQKIGEGGGSPMQQAGGFFGLTPAGSNITHSWQEQREAEAARTHVATPLEKKRQADVSGMSPEKQAGEKIRRKASYRGRKARTLSP